MTLKSITTAELQAELVRRRRSAQGLSEKRERLAVELAAVEAELALLTGRRRARTEPAAAAPRPARSVNNLTLADALAACIRTGEVLSPQEAAERVRAAGYVSGARSFGPMVSTALARDKRFRRLGRGRYERTA
jgi:hypothetical protein